MEAVEKIVNLSNFLDFIKNPSFNNIKLGDCISTILEFVKGGEYREIRNKYFHLIAIGNVELTFFGDKLQKLHFEVDKPILRIYSFQLKDFNVIKEIITNSGIVLREVLENEFIGFENVKLYFENGKLIDLYFEL